MCYRRFSGGTPLRPTLRDMTNAPHVLVVDDDREIRDLLARFLRMHGYRIEAAADGQEMFAALGAGRFDLIVLDLMLPGEDGLSLCRRVRADSNVPVIMLTAVGEDTDRIVGLEVGADDYLPKPFNPRELLARIRAVLRRATEVHSQPYGGRSRRFAFQGWTLDAVRRNLHAPDGTAVDLTAGEFALLLVLLEHPGRVLTRDQLLDLTRGREAGPFDRSVDIQVSRLRRKIDDDPKRPELIKTVRNSGYVFAGTVREDR